MKLEEPKENFGFQNYQLKLPSDKNNSHYLDKSKENNEKNTSNKIIKEIKSLLTDMKQNEHRTINFATILYIVEKDYEKIPFENIKLKFRNDFKNNNKMFINKKTKIPFDSESNLIRSFNTIKKNKLFKLEIIDNKKYISINPPKVLDYLKKMYNKYTSNYNGDISSIDSLETKETKKAVKKSKKNGYRSEKVKKSVNLLGNKILRIDSKIKYEENIMNEKEQIQFLKDNLLDIKPNKNKEKDKNLKITDFLEKKLNFPKIVEEKDLNPPLALLIQEIDSSINAFDKAEKNLSSNKTKLKNLKLRLEEKEKLYKAYEDGKLKFDLIKNKLDILYGLLQIKLGIIQSTKKHKYYGEFFQKSKNIVLNYTFLFDEEINDIKERLSNIHSIKEKIKNENAVILEEVNKFEENSNEINYFGKKDIDNNIKGFKEKIMNEIKNRDNLFVGYDSIGNTNLIEEIKYNFKEISIEIFEEIEYYDK